MENTLNNPENINVLWVVAAFTLTITLIALTAFIARKLLTHIPVMSRKGGKARLEVSEWRPIDGKHQLYLIRRDDVEHLVLLSAHGSPTVIEKRIRNDHVSYGNRAHHALAADRRHPRDLAGPLKASEDTSFPLGPARRKDDPPNRK